MTAEQLMWRHAEAWVRAIGLEWAWGVPRDEVVRRAAAEVGWDPVRINAVLRDWQRERPLQSLP